MAAEPFAGLLRSDLPTEALVRHGLRLLEADFRERALFALAGWEQAGLEVAARAGVAPELFAAVAALQRPSWGNWNGLLTALRKARAALLKGGDAALRQRLEGAGPLARALDPLDEPLEPAVERGLEPLARLVRSRLPGRPRLGQVLALPIALRNRVVHDLPTDPDWWQQAAAALRPLLGFLARPRPGEANPLPAPWLLGDGGQVWAFNGTENDFTPVYVSGAGQTRHEPARGQEVLLAFQRLLGKAGGRERDFKGLLARLAPEDVKGVLFGDYLLGRPVGEGGFATVHLGRQLSTGRKVALKVLRGDATDEQRARFHREAAFLARLDHPHVVRVLGSGEETWSPPRLVPLADEEWYQRFARSAAVKPYIALEWIDGQTLDAVFRAGPAGRPGVPALADWFAQAAEGLAAVHAGGLVHRDVKPGNLMVTEDGKVKLMDLGIARSDDEARTLHTAAGQVLGTPAYMAPEQLRSDQAEAEVGPAADVYALCATFYELFTGARLFRHDTVDRASVLTLKLSGGPPEPPRRLAPGLPWEVETLLLGGLEREPADRPAGAAPLAADLRRFQANEPIRYRRPPLRRRLQLFYRRNRALVNLALAFAVLAAGGTAAALASLRSEQARTEAQARLTQQESDAKEVATRLAGERARVAAEKTRLARAKEEEARAAALRKYLRDYVTDMQRLPAAWERNDLQSVLALLDRHRPEKTGQADQRGFEWYYWSWLSRGSALNVFRYWSHGSSGLSLAFSQNGSLLAAGGFRGVKVWDLASSREVMALAPKATRSPVAFSPDGTRLAAFQSSYTVGPGRLAPAQVWVWEVPTGKEVLRLPAPPAREAGGLAFSPDGRWLAWSWPEVPRFHPGGVRVWDLAANRELLSSATRAASPRLLFGPKGNRLLMLDRPEGSREGVNRPFVRAWDLPSGKESAAFEPRWGEIAFVSGKQGAPVPGRPPDVVLRTAAAFVRPLAVSPDARRLLLETQGKTALAYHHLAQPPVLLEGFESVSAPVFCHDGAWLALAHRFSNRISLLDTSSLRELATFRGHAAGIGALQFSADCRRLASASYDGTVRVWDLTRRPQGRFSPRLTRTAAPSRREVARLGDGSSIVQEYVHGSNPKLAFRKVPGGRLLATFPVGGNLTVSANGTRLARFTAANHLECWDLPAGRLLFSQHLPRLRHSHFTLVFNPEASQLVVTNVNRVIDATTGKLLFPLPGASQGWPALQAAYSPDGRRLLVAQGGKITVCDARTGKEITALQAPPGTLSALAVSADGGQVAAATAGGLRLWDLSTSRASSLVGHTGWVDRLAFSPDGKRLASRDRGGSVRLWDTLMGEEVLHLPEGVLPLDDIFGPPGRQLVERERARPASP